MSEYVILNNGELVAYADGDDSCRPYEWGSLCGGCDDCLISQAHYYGYDVIPIRIFNARKYVAKHAKRRRDARIGVLSVILHFLLISALAYVLL